jgi:EpsI family protein
MNYAFSLALLKKRRFRIVTVIFLLQWFALLSFSREEITPQVPAMRLFPHELGSWRLARETVIESEALSILQPDDYIVREYHEGESGRLANLFVAYFGTQRTERMPHSPKNCLPGSGWVPSGYSTVAVHLPQTASPVTVNRYLVQKEDQRALVLYWYQTWSRGIANEYAARLYLALDSIRYNRTDTALVRIMLPLPDGVAATEYESTALDFMKSVYPRLALWFPAP